MVKVCASHRPSRHAPKTGWCATRRRPRRRFLLVFDERENDIENRRQVTIGSTINERLNADYDAQAVSGYVEAAWTFEAGSARYTPYLNVTHTRLVCDCCGERLEARDVRAVAGPGADR